MSCYDLPTVILAQDAERTSLADDCELVQRLVADAERAWEEAVEDARRRAGEPETRTFRDAGGCPVRARLAPPPVGEVAGRRQILFESDDGTWLGSAWAPGSVALGQLGTEELRRMLDAARAAGRG